MRTWIKQHPYQATGGAIAIVFSSWLLFAALLYSLSSMLIFNTHDSKTATVEFPHEQLWLTDAKQRKIDTLWFHNPGASKVVLYLHGNRGRLNQFFAPMAEKFNVLAPAYPGFHQSEGKPSNDDVYSTSLIAYDYLVNQGYKNEDIIVFGHSLGGSAAVYTAAQRPTAGKLVIVNTFNSMFDMCWAEWNIGCIFAKSLFNTASYAPFVYTDVRQYHDKDDNVVPYEQGVKLFTHFTGTENKKFITLPEEDSHSEFDVAKVLSDS